MVDHFKEWGVGEACRVPEKNCTLQNVSIILFVIYIFFSLFFFPLLSSLFSISDVDFIVWFLKRWYFFRKNTKNKPFMNVFLLLEYF